MNCVIRDKNAQIRNTKEVSDTEEARQEKYTNFRNELYKRELSNTESFDKAILSLSSAGLAISLTFIKFVVPIEKAEQMYFLYSAWISFGLSIVAVIISFISSQAGINEQLKNAEEYYIKNNKKVLDKENRAAILTKWLNHAAALFFVIAIVSIIFFAIWNFNQSKHTLSSNEARTMSNEKKIIGGATVPTMQQTIKEGATVPDIPPTISNQTTPQNTESKTDNNQGNKLENNEKLD